jgi:hypothetical protein
MYYLSILHPTHAEEIVDVLEARAFRGMTNKRSIDFASRIKEWGMK